MPGKTVRLHRLFRPGRRLFAVPMDHGTSIGPVQGLQDVTATLAAVVAGGVDAVVVHKGLARQIVQGGGPGCEMIVHLSASTDLAPDPNNKQLVCTPEYAVRLGATAVSVHVNLGSPDEPSMLKDLGRVAEQCDHWGIPLLAMMYVRGGPPEGEYDPGKVAHAARVAEELGADIVKVNYTGSPDTFAVVTGAVKVPVLIAGGPRMSSIEELLVTVRDALRAGAKGVALGRNVFQDPRPKALARTIRRLIDDTSPRADIEALVHDYHMNEACTRGERSG